MRVCMLLRNLFVRDARVLREARALTGAGHDVTVLALRARDLPARERRDGFTIVRVEAGRTAGPSILGAGSAGGAAAGRSFRPAAAVWARDVLLSRRLAAAARRIPADVYHAHDLNTLAAARSAARARSAHLVYDAHELYPDLTGLAPSEAERWRRAERRLIAHAAAVIVPSAARGEEMVRRYGIPTPAVVMNCPPRQRIDRKDTSALPALRAQGSVLAVYAGGFTPNRGLENLIHAASLWDGVTLAMLGWGPLEAELRAIAARETAPVVFAGSVEPDDVVAAVAGADIGLAPYLPIGLNNVLAAPNKLFEYLHAGLAVAASDLPDIRRVVTEHGVGALFDAADPGSIARAVTSLAADRQALGAMKARAAEAAERYTWEAQAVVLAAVYDRLGSSPASHSTGR